MAKVLAFPVKKKLPKHIEERLHKVAREYIDALNTALELLSDGENGPIEYDELVNLVADTYVEGLVKAANQLDES